MDGGTIPKSWQQATISMIPKVEHRCPDVKDYRLISLLNSDYKIFAKVIAEGLKKVLIKDIGEDQVGFLVVLNILEYGDVGRKKNRPFLLRRGDGLRLHKLVVYGGKF